jgi:hypothetical protein
MMELHIAGLQHSMLVSVQGITIISLTFISTDQKENHIRLFTWNITDTHAIRASYTPVIWSIFNLVGWHHQFSAQTLALRTCMPCITICNMVEITMALAKLANQFKGN